MEVDEVEDLKAVTLVLTLAFPQVQGVKSMQSNVALGGNFENHIR